ncbi:24601_t:CDS:2, partial [Racocetra persica]
ATSITGLALRVFRGPLVFDQDQQTQRVYDSTIKSSATLWTKTRLVTSDAVESPQ